MEALLSEFTYGWSSFLGSAQASIQSTSASELCLQDRTAGFFFWRSARSLENDSICIFVS